MRRDRLINATHHLREAILAAEVHEVLQLDRILPQNDDGRKTQKILNCYSAFSQHYMNFGNEEKHLMAVYGLNPLVNVNFWSAMLDDAQEISEKIRSDVEVGVYNILYVMPKLRELLRRDTDRPNLAIALEDGTNLNVKRMRVIVSGEGNLLLSSTVFIQIIRAVEELYESISLLHRTGYVALSVGSLDSGEVKSLDFFGCTEFIQEMEQILLDVWQRARHSSDGDFAYQVEVALMGAGFTNRVAKARSDKLVTEEEERRILAGVAKAIEILLQNGAYTEEMEKNYADYSASPASLLIEKNSAERPSLKVAGQNAQPPFVHNMAGNAGQIEADARADKNQYNGRNISGQPNHQFNGESTPNRQNIHHNAQNGSHQPKQGANAAAMSGVKFSQDFPDKDAAGPAPLNLTAEIERKTQDSAPKA